MPDSADNKERALQLRTVRDAVGRFSAFVAGDQVGAERLTATAEPTVPKWLIAARSDDDLSNYALEAARRSHQVATEALERLQGKAAALLALLVGAAPIVIGGTAAVVAQRPPGLLGIAGSGLLALADVLIVYAALMAALASGLLVSIGLNIERLGRDRSTELRQDSVRDLRVDEALVWHQAALQAMTSTTRVAVDLFAARRWAFTCLLCLLAGAALLLLADLVAPEQP